MEDSTIHLLLWAFISFNFILSHALVCFIGMRLSRVCKEMAFKLRWYDTYSRQDAPEDGSNQKR